MGETVFNTVREMLHTASLSRYTGIATVLRDEAANQYYFNDGVVVEVFGYINNVEIKGIE